jgi:hypothetical protein
MAMDPGLEAYFYRTRDLWKEYISRNVALDLRMLEDNEAYLDWYLVSQKKAIRWTPEIIERFESNWDWMKLTRNRALYRRIKSIEPLIKKYIDRWSWKYLQKRRKYLVTAELLQLNRSRKVRYTDMPGCFRYATDWHGGERDGFQTLLSQHGELVNWSTLSSFRGLTEAMIQEYEDRWDWKVLSQNPWLPYSLKLLRIYRPKWIWPIHAAHGSKLKLFSRHIDFNDAKFWGPATDRGGKNIQNGYKMKWHNLGPGRVQLRLSVAILSSRAFLCRAYVKSSDAKDKREATKLKDHIQDIHFGRHQERGVLR